MDLKLFKVISSILLHLEKAELPIETKLSKLISFKFSQLENAYEFKFSILGIVILINCVHPEKAELPIDVKLLKFICSILLDS